MWGDRNIFLLEYVPIFPHPTFCLPLGNFQVSKKSQKYIFFFIKTLAEAAHVQGWMSENLI